MPNRSNISIVTPSYNQGRFLEDCLVSVKEQDYRPLEHIVIDGASRDDSVEILKRFSSQPGWEHLRWISEPDSGQTQAINKGFGMARGDILAYLCSDDSYAPGAFEFVSSYFHEHPEVDLVYGECWFIDANGIVLRRKRPEAFDARRLARANCIWQPTVFFRSTLLRTVGEFNESLRYAMDYEYWLRAARIGRFAVVDRHLANYRLHRDSKTVATTRAQLREGYEIGRRNGGGGLVSWYLHHVYWPGTSRFKLWLFSRLSAMH